MLLTKDNLLNFIKNKKFVTPTDISKQFSTTTLVASAALSQLVDKQLIKITYLKVGSSPFYYLPEQKEYLQELAEKYLSKNDLKIYEKIRKEKIINDNNLTAIEKLSIKNIRDFAIPLDINFKDKNIKFWIWYLLDISKTKLDIINALKLVYEKSVNKKDKEETINKNKVKKDIPESNIKSNKNKEVEKNNNLKIFNINSEFNKLNNNLENKKESFNSINKKTEKKLDEEEFVEEFFRENNLKIIKKEKESNKIYYELILKNNFEINLEAKIFLKKIKEIEIINFYLSSNKPKLIFIKNPNKKLKTITKEIINLFLIEIN